jgi:hypothetical protein
MPSHHFFSLTQASIDAACNAEYSDMFVLVWRWRLVSQSVFCGNCKSFGVVVVRRHFLLSGCLLIKSFHYLWHHLGQKQKRNELRD